MNDNWPYSLYNQHHISNKKENLELKKLIKELQEAHNQKVKSQADLLASIDRLTKQVAVLTGDNKKLQQQIDGLLNRYKRNKAN